MASRTWHCWFFVLLCVVPWCPRRTIKNSCCALFVTEISASGAEDRTNGDFLIGPTCYFCWILRHTYTCAHINTHNLRNVSKRFECQGFPSCWPGVRAAAGLWRVAVYKETQRTTWQVLFTAEEQSICLHRGLQPNTFLNVPHVSHQHVAHSGVSLESTHKNSHTKIHNPFCGYQ